MADHVPQWEYLTISLAQLGDLQLEACGKDGWEAVCTLPDWEDGPALLFKRPLPKGTGHGG